VAPAASEQQPRKQDPGMGGIRLLDTTLNRLVVVETASGRSWADLNGDGRIDAAEALRGPANDSVQTAAVELQKWFLAAVPGSTLPGSPFVLAGAASSQELAVLDKGGAIAAKRSELAQHLDFFDANGDGKLSPIEIFRGFRRVGVGRLAALIKAVASAVIFGGFRNRLQVDIDAIGARRRGSSTGIYDADGNLDEARLAELRAEFHNRGGALTARDLKIVLEQRRIGPVSKRQFGSLAAACFSINGARTITSQQLADLYRGSPLWQVASLTDHRGRRRL
jgi:hypothetical protein